MVRERVGDWRFALGLVAGVLVVILSTRGVMNGPFFAAVVLVCTADVHPTDDFLQFGAAVGERGLAAPDDANNIRGVVLRHDPNATCKQNEADEPAFVQALRISQ